MKNYFFVHVKYRRNELTLLYMKLVKTVEINIFKIQIGGPKPQTISFSQPVWKLEGSIMFQQF